MVRVDQPDLVYRTEEAKFAAVVEDIADRFRTGQPVLVGTTSVEKSEYLSGLLRDKGVAHSVLNAKEHENEAKIVALAGHKGAVTVATNMAGRGTDIMLGGSVDFLADQELRRQGLDPVENADEFDAAWPAMVEKVKAQVAAEHDEVRELGGLYVLGTERHESRRIDNQLRGRSGRQGDPGESRFYLSLRDDLMRLFKSDWVEWVLTTLKVPDDQPIENKRVTSSIASAQGQVESQNFESRKNVLKYDDVMSRQREVIYKERRAVLEGADLHEQVQAMIDQVVAGYVDGATTGFPEEWNLDALWTALKTLFPVSVKLADLEEEAGGRDGLDRDLLRETLTEDAHRAYAEREESIGSEVMRELERRVVLSVLDRKWREHLYEMDYLREGIGLRAYSQRDPLVEYQREGFDMFATMMDGIKEESVAFLFNLEVQVEEEPEEAEEQVDEEESARLAALFAAAPPGAPAAPAPAAPAAPPAAASTAPPAAAEAPALRQSSGRPHVHAKGLDSTPRTDNLTYTAPSETGGTEVSRSAAVPEDPYSGVGRNQLCPCGSGKKYKRCHGAPGGASGQTSRVG
jgi:preprotein translocase subunit SecA